GLATVYGIIQQHNANINLYSEPGHGTTFKIFFPVTEGEVEIAAEKSPAEARRGTETVLVAEDDERLRRLTRTVLEEAGYTVIEAVDGEDALDKFSENKNAVHLIISDVIMPKKNGIEVCKEIKKMRPAVKALFLSGYAADIISSTGMIEEGIELVHKPVSHGELLLKIRKILDS
ncbi:MAG: response regulator, partial [Nitrospirae bacterium]|nr:response regulator [Nitrospirota bacterium]